MKKLIYLLPLILLLSCNDNYDTAMCMQGVRQHYVNNKQVFLLPGYSYRFIVIDSGGNTLYVETMGKWNKITKEILINK